MAPSTVTDVKKNRPPGGWVKTQQVGTGIADQSGNEGGGRTTSVPSPMAAATIMDSRMYQDMKGMET